MLRKLEALISAGGQGQAQSSGATHKAGGEANEAGGSSVHNSAQHQWGRRDLPFHLQLHGAHCRRWRRWQVFHL